MLSRSRVFPGVAGPVVTVVMDGIGQRSATAGNAVRDAHTPTLDRLFARYPHTLLKAHGTAVGMPSDEDMGNSEVGHNALGSGQVYAQGAALVNDAIAGGSLFAGATWGEIVANVLASGGTLHFLGLFSDGNVHAHIEHLKALITAARGAGVRRVRIHALLDGRDVPATSALDYVLPFEQFLAGLRSGELRCAHRQRRRAHVHHDGPLRGRLGHGGARLGHARARRGAPLRHAPPRRSRRCAAKSRVSATRTCRPS